MIDPTLARRQIAADRRPGHRSNPNPRATPVLDMHDLINGALATLREELRAEGRPSNRLTDR